MNVVVLRGSLSRSPQARSLPSGDLLGAFEVTVRPRGRPAETVPVVWFDPRPGALALPAGAEVVVVGRVRRRFYRGRAGRASRTEVVAAGVLRAEDRTRVLGALDGVVALVTDPAA